MKQKAGKRTAYTAKQKLAMIKFAEQHGNRATERKFDVSESCIRGWRKVKKRLETWPENRMAGRGSEALYPELESVMIAFIKEKQHRGVPVSFQVIRNEAKEIAQRLHLTTFRASVNWVYSFLRRSELKH